jgi:hypothetical protein
VIEHGAISIDLTVIGIDHAFNSTYSIKPSHSSWLSQPLGMKGPELRNAIDPPRFEPPEGPPETVSNSTGGRTAGATGGPRDLGLDGRHLEGMG